MTSVGKRLKADLLSGPVRMLQRRSLHPSHWRRRL